MQPFSAGPAIRRLRPYLNNLVHTQPASLVAAVLSLRVGAPLSNTFFLCPSLEEGGGGAQPLPSEGSVPCYFNPLRGDLFNKCLSLFSCRPLREQTEHVFCFPQIKESIRGGCDGEREGDNWAIYGFILCRCPPVPPIPPTSSPPLASSFPVDAAKCTQLQ